MRLWLVVLGAAAGTYLLRVSFVTLLGRVDEVPTRVERTLTFVPPAVLAALVLPELLMRGDALAVSAGNHRLLAGAVATLVAWRTEDMFATVIAGMGALYAITWLL